MWLDSDKWIVSLDKLDAAGGADATDTLRVCDDHDDALTLATEHPMIRLRDLDPQAVAAEADNHVLDRAHTLAMAVGARVTADSEGISDVRHAVHALALYARDGVPPEGRPELLGEYFISLVGVDLIPDDLDAEPDTSWGVVVLAAVARQAIEEQRTVPDEALGALAGVDGSRVRQLVGEGVLRRMDRPSPGRALKGIAPADARRWLSGRGVVGFAEAS